jgi:3-oxoacyl-(acyl-carrier-protein) synthase
MSWDITGIGAVASVGRDPYEIFGSLCSGHVGLGGLRAFDRSRYRAQRAYEIDDRAEYGRDEPGRATRWLLTAVLQALEDAGLDDAPGAYPVLIGTTLREQRTAELWWRKEAPLALRDLHFGTALNTGLGVTRSYTFAGACAASLCTLGLATDLIALELADTVVVAGTDSITESVFGTLDRVQNGVPDALRPFDRDRRGMVPGEGAVAVVVRRPGTHAGRVHGRLRAVSMNCDARHPTAPTPPSIARAIRDAHRRADLDAADIDLVLLHGTGTALNDVSEAAALTDVFGVRDPGPLMTAIKAATGHTLGGSGLLSLVMAALALDRGAVPPIAGLTHPIDEAAGLRLVREGTATAHLATAQVNAFGFGGINAVAIMEKAI